MSNDTSSGRRHPLARCEDCTLNNKINTFVPSCGPVDAKLAIVGEGPGYQEAKGGIPFSGPSGSLLNATLEANGIARNDVVLTNAVLCRPPGNRTPTKEEVSCCAPRLQAELQSLYNLEQVVTLGNTATQALLNTTIGITQMRVGPPKRSPYLKDVEIIPTFHPAAALRQADYFPSIAADFQKLDRSNRVTWEEPIYRIFDTEVHAVAVLEELLAQTTIGAIVMDIEVGIEKDTDFDHPERYGFLCVGIGYARRKVIVIGERALSSDRVRRTLGSLLRAKEVWCHNGKFDLSGISGLGIRKVPLGGDTMLASYILDERQGTHALGALSQEVLGAPDWKHVLDQWVGSGKKKKSYALVPRDILYKYNAFDVSCTWDLMEYYVKELAKTPKFTQLHYETCRVSDMLQHVEEQGICVNEEYFEKLDTSYRFQLDVQEKTLAEWVDNPRSPLQVKNALHDMAIRVQTTNALQLEIILRAVDWESEVGRFVLAMQRYRRDIKMYGTYIKGMRSSIYEGRIHGNFLLHGTTSGRWSCKKPNLLNIPRGPIIKSGFVADEGKVFVQSDLKTAELRVVAIEAGCPWLLDVLGDPNRDIHGEVATQRYGSGWSKDQRVRAKAVVFGLGYGREATSIALEFDISVHEAQEVINAFFKLIPEVRAWQADIRRRVWAGEDLVNAFGRKRRFHLITRENKENVGREALSFLPQSTANDINQRAAALCWRELGIDVRLCVHDSILAVCSPDDAEETAKLISWAQMKIASKYTTDLPFFTDTSIGQNWGELS